MLAPENADLLVRGIVRMIASSDRVNNLTDRELCKEVVDKVWGKVILGSDQDWLIDELLTRFEKHCEIKRDSEGEIIPEIKSEPSQPKD